MPRVVDHHDRCAVACAETFDFDHGERSARIGLSGRRCPASRAISSVTRSAPLIAHDSVRQTCSDEPADRLGIEHRVERHDVLDVGRRDLRAGPRRTRMAFGRDVSDLDPARDRAPAARPTASDPAGTR